MNLQHDRTMARALLGEGPLVPSLGEDAGLVAIGPPVNQPRPIFPGPVAAVVFESRHAEPGFGRVRFQQEFAKYLLMLEGEAVVEGSGRKFVLKKDSLLHVPAKTVHFYQDRPREEVVLYAIHYRPECLPSPLAVALSAHGVAHWCLRTCGMNLVRRCRSHFQEMLFEQRAQREGWEAIVVAHLTQLAVFALRLSHRHSAGIAPVFEPGDLSSERLATFIEGLKHSFYRSHTIKEATEATGMSRHAFTTHFRRATGQTFRRYVEARRLSYAQELLQQTDLSVLAVAFEAGFENGTTFHRTFRRICGCSPQQWRLKAQQPGSRSWSRPRNGEHRAKTLGVQPG